MYVSILFLLLNTGVIAHAMSVQAAEPPLSKPRGNTLETPTTITSQKMTVRNQANQAVFEGAVVLTRGALIVKSDQMIVFFHEKNGESKSVNEGVQADNVGTMSSPSNRSLEKVEAIGHVNITQEKSHATCQKAVYVSAEEKIILTGDPVAWEKGTRVSGKRITIYLAEERSVVEGDTHVRITGED